jgi:hypothetical protein
MDIFPVIKKVPPLPHEKVLRLAVTRIQAGYKPGWLYYRCKEQRLLEIFEKYQKKGYFDILEKGASNPTQTPRLTVELVPRTCWFNNVRSAVSEGQWNYLKKKTSNKANWKCEICGGRGPKWPVECHERWHYDDEYNTQKLCGLIALCPSCHEVKHIGLAELKGKKVEATAHLAIVNGWSYQAADKYIKDAFKVWRDRSQHNWILDISWIKDIGIKIKSNTVSKYSTEKDVDIKEETTVIQSESESTVQRIISFCRPIFSLFNGKNSQFR